MADYKLADGREITFDLYKITRKEYRRLFEVTQPAAEENETMAKAAGLKVEDVDAMPYPVFRRFAAAFFKKCREPLDTTDPKGSDGASS